MADDHNPDRAAEQVRDDLASVRAALVADPADFGLGFASADDLVARADQAADRPVRRRRWAAMGAGLAAAAAVGAVLVLPRLGDGGPMPSALTPARTASPTASPTESPAAITYGSARDVLLAAARVTGPETRSARFWHVRSLQVFGTEESPREIWIGNGRPSVLRQDGFLDRLPAVTFPVGGRSMGWAALQQLPTDPASLRSLLAADASAAGRDARWVIFKAAGDLVAEAPLPPGVRGALWRVLAAVPGTRLEPARDATGRRGWAVSLTLPEEGSVTYVVDPSSGQLLEARHAPDGGLDPWRVTYLERGPADAAPALTGT